MSMLASIRFSKDPCEVLSSVPAVVSRRAVCLLQDKLVGYLSFLKIGPKLLRFLPGKKARDLKNWLTIYGA